MFPLATSLSSTISAGLGPLFDGFSGTTDVSDFSAAWTAGLRLLAFPAPPGACAPGTAEISQFLCEGLPDVHDLVFLDLQCFMELESETAFVELISYLVPPDPRQAPYHSHYGFKSTELPSDFTDQQMAISVRAQPEVAYFASLSPAVPTRRFTQLIGASPSATIRYHWRDGSSVSSSDHSRRYEVALLAVHRGALTLPPGWKIAWVLRVDGVVRAVLNNV